VKEGRKKHLVIGQRHLDLGGDEQKRSQLYSKTVGKKGESGPKNGKEAAQRITPLF